MKFLIKTLINKLNLSVRYLPFNFNKTMADACRLVSCRLMLCSVVLCLSIGWHFFVNAGFSFKLKFHSKLAMEMKMETGMEMEIKPTPKTL